MADLRLPPNAVTAKCGACDHELLVSDPRSVRIKHHADGSHTCTPVTPPRQRTDPKPRGRRRG